MWEGLATKITEEGAIHNTKCDLASFASYCCDKDHSPKQTDEKEFILAHSSQSVMKSRWEVSAETWKQEPDQRPGRSTAFQGLLKRFLMQPRTKLSRSSLPTVLGPPTSTINQENTYRLAYRPVGGRYFLFFFFF